MITLGKTVKRRVKQSGRRLLDAATDSITLWRAETIHAIQKAQGKEFVHFLHIGKTGGSAVSFALHKYASYTPYVIHTHTHDVTLRDIPVGEKVIFFLRDPISRFMSGFYSRQRQGQPRIQAAWSPDEQVAFEYFATANQLALALSTTDETELRKAHHAMGSINHVRNSYWDWFESEAYLLSRLSDIFFVGFQENLEHDFEALCVKLGLPEHARLPDDPIQAHRNPSHVSKRLDDEAVENLRRWYCQDFAFIAFIQKTII